MSRKFDLQQVHMSHDTRLKKRVSQLAILLSYPVGGFEQRLRCVAIR